MSDALYSSFKEMLEIALITHNSASALGNTLQQLSESLFRNAKITVFDNGSNDTTQDVCFQYAARLPQLGVVRYTKDIGLEAACLHAVESLSAQYGWILCDDIRCDFSYGNGLLQAIRSNDFDALFVGSRDELGWNGAETCEMDHLLTADTALYCSFTFWSALIFRTSLFNEECLVKGYRLINNVFSNFPFVNMLVETNAKLYISPRQFVIKREGQSHNVVDLYSYSAWINCCQSISRLYLREMEICNVTSGNGILSTFSYWISQEDTFGSKRFWNAIIDIIWGVPARLRCKLLLLCFLMFLPMPRTWCRALLRRLAVWSASVRENNNVAGVKEGSL